ncbi:hypothetical protein A2W14_03755 [Candidatus Gottesmanbacteria bacterium RBG_16_37_8]|uniref:Uncharacterized protein n=1 Tax=Candidatus Gottesmanbacteria bacterium RBG_16_37_8 TaxID=1798371 RepID=A0A1F5YNM8_9BACT|nr:MAG: hypothetical protein A2W14_03755 [Candidatus Gottesmanbacteria bacterium RBG_16_37_8]
MAKYKIIGAVNFFLGIFEIVYPLIVILFTIPRLTELYAEFQAKGPNLIPTYIILSIVMLMGVGNFILGVKLFSKSENKEKFFKIAIILIIASFLLGGVITKIASLSVIMPIYNLTSEF